MQGHVVDKQFAFGERNDFRLLVRRGEVVDRHFADVGDEQVIVFYEQSLGRRQRAVGRNQHPRNRVGEFEDIAFTLGVQRIELVGAEAADQQFAVQRQRGFAEYDLIGENGRCRRFFCGRAGDSRYGNRRKENALFHNFYFSVNGSYCENRFRKSSCCAAR